MARFVKEKVEAAIREAKLELSIHERYAAEASNRVKFFRETRIPALEKMLEDSE